MWDALVGRRMAPFSSLDRTAASSEMNEAAGGELGLGLPAAHRGAKFQSETNIRSQV